MSHGNYMLSAYAGAANMAHPDVIKACRVTYRLAWLAPSQLDAAHVCRVVARAWKRGDVAIMRAALESLEVMLRDVEGAYPAVEQLRENASRLLWLEVAHV